MNRSEARSVSERAPFAGRLSTVIVAVVVVAMVATLVVIVWQKSRAPLTDYDGIIVDRWSDTSETQIGSMPRFSVLVESDNGARFTVRVDRIHMNLRE